MLTPGTNGKETGFGSYLDLGGLLEIEATTTWGGCVTTREHSEKSQQILFAANKAHALLGLDCHWIWPVQPKHLFSNILPYTPS